MGTGCCGTIIIKDDPLFVEHISCMSLDTQFLNLVQQAKVQTNDQKLIYYISNKWNQNNGSDVSGQGLIYKPMSFLYLGHAKNSVPISKGSLYWYHQEKSKLFPHINSSQNKNLNFGKIEGSWRRGKFQSGKYFPYVNADPKEAYMLHNVKFEQNPEDIRHFNVEMELNDKQLFYRGQMRLDRKRKAFVMEGKGRLIWQTKNNSDNSPLEYDGEWKANKMDGFGQFTWRNKSKYVGQYKQGKKHGKGKFYYNDIYYIQATWKEGKKEGPGIEYKNNVARELFWKEDNLVEKK